MEWKIGFCQGAFGSLDLGEIASILLKLECDAIEIWSYHPTIVPYVEGKKDPSGINRLMRKYNLSYSVHAPHYDLNISGLNDRIRYESLRQSIEAVQFAAKIEADLVVLHPGKRTTIEAPDEVYLERSVESIREVCDVAEELGLRIGLENMDSKRVHFANKPEVLLSILKGVKSTNLGITFDVAHANTCMRPADFLKPIADKVIHLHLSDNCGPTSPSFHMPMGTGTVNLAEIFEILMENGYKGLLIVEGRGKNLEEFIKSTLKEIKTAMNVAKEQFEG